MTTRQPLSVFGRLAAATLLATALLFTTLRLVIGSDGGIVLFIIAAVLLAAAGVVATGLRWAPVLEVLLSTVLLYVFLFVVPFPVYHLTHPTAASENAMLSFVLFVLIVLILWCLVVGWGAGIFAAWQNYRQAGPQKPAWFTSTLTGLVGVLIGAIVIGAMAPASTATAGATTETAASTSGGPATVHMGPGNFLQSSVEVQRGAQVQLVDDAAFPHVIRNGLWASGVAQPATEAGAPSAASLTTNGKPLVLGPFSASGTFHFYCTIHPGMNLVVQVK